MPVDIGPFTFMIDPGAIAGTGLWAIGLYLGFSPIANWLIDRLSQWMGQAERSLYTSIEEFERTRPAREAQNTFYASLLGIIPFLILGALFNYGTELSLGKTWGTSVGVLVCIGCGVYELGRRDGQANQEDDDD